MRQQAGRTNCRLSAAHVAHFTAALYSKPGPHLQDQDGHRGTAGPTRGHRFRLRRRGRPFTGGVQHVRTAGADHAGDAVGRRLRPQGPQLQADGGCATDSVGAGLPATLAGIAADIRANLEALESDTTTLESESWSTSCCLTAGRWASGWHRRLTKPMRRAGCRRCCGKLPAKSPGTLHV